MEQDNETVNETTDAVIELLNSVGAEITRENYIELNWMGNPPEEWTVEDELQLPEELQDWSQFYSEGEEEEDDQVQAVPKGREPTSKQDMETPVKGGRLSNSISRARGDVGKSKEGGTLKDRKGPPAPKNNRGD
jgi:hypothetical protein